MSPGRQHRAAGARTEAACDEGAVASGSGSGSAFGPRGGRDDRAPSRANTSPRDKRAQEPATRGCQPAALSATGHVTSNGAAIAGAGSGRLDRIADLLTALSQELRSLSESCDVQLAGSAASRLMDDVASNHELPTRNLDAPRATARLLSAADLSDRLAVDQKTIRRWAREGKLPEPLRLGDGSLLRWRPGDIDRWLAEEGPA